MTYIRFSFSQVKFNVLFHCDLSYYIKNLDIIHISHFSPIEFFFSSKWFFFSIFIVVQLLPQFQNFLKISLKLPRPVPVISHCTSFLLLLHIAHQLSQSSRPRLCWFGCLYDHSGLWHILSWGTGFSSIVCVTRVSIGSVLLPSDVLSCINAKFCLSAPQLLYLRLVAAVRCYK